MTNVAIFGSTYMRLSAMMLKESERGRLAVCAGCLDAGAGAARCPQRMQDRFRPQAIWRVGRGRAGLLRNWDRERENTALTRRAFNTDRTATLLNDPLADRQPQTGAVLAGG